MQEIRFLQLNRTISFAILVNEQGKSYPGLLAKMPGITCIAQSHRGESYTSLPECLLVIAQLRNVLAAKNSTIMAQEYYDGGSLRP